MEFENPVFRSVKDSSLLQSNVTHSAEHSTLYFATVVFFHHRRFSNYINPFCIIVRRILRTAAGKLCAPRMSMRNVNRTSEMVVCVSVCECGRMSVVVVVRPSPGGMAVAGKIGG